jgi:predicted GNAT family acetyltransferase
MPSVPTGDPAVSNNLGAQRYEIRIDDRLAGFAAYVTANGKIVFTHTEIEPAFEGQGIGSRLAKAALDDARTHHEAVRPQCPFISAYIERHSEYADLVERPTP